MIDADQQDGANKKKQLRERERFLRSKNEMP